MHEIYYTSLIIPVHNGESCAWYHRMIHVVRRIVITEVVQEVMKLENTVIGIRAFRLHVCVKYVAVRSTDVSV
jgi:hypothetical protein